MTSKRIAAIKQACRLADQCMLAVSGQIRLGVSEKVLTDFIHNWMTTQALRPAFPPIVAVDENSVQIHHDLQKNGAKKIAVGSVIMIDLGVRFEGYCSDITRMFAVGKPSDKFVATYQGVLLAQEATISHLGNELSGKEVDRFCHNLISKNLKLTIPHSVGHGVGRKIHQKPKIGPKSTDIIRPGDVVTIEPGIYLPDKFGIRIEDTVLIGIGGKPERLTRFPRGLFIIDK